jgi:glycosyltransferase involved in cell wall biosynthesis
MKRVALLRGDSLNRYEMQSYEPLLAEWDMIAFTSWDNPHDLSGMRIPVQRLRAATDFMRMLPARLRRYGDFTLRHVLEMHAPFVGLERQLKNFDIIHTADAHYFYSYQAVRAKQRYGNKVVVTQWENIPFLFERRIGARRRKQKTLANVDLFIAVTERAKEVLLLEGAPPERILVIPTGVDVQRFKPLTRDAALCAALGIESDDKVILFVGRLVRSKGIFELLFALHGLLRDADLAKQRLKLVCVGPGDQSEFKTWLQRLNIAAHVVVAGNFSYEQIPAIHNLAEVFVLPSVPTYRWREQFGMALLESMACGKAVLSTLSGSIPEIVGEAGVLVQPYDHLALYQGIKRLLLDEALCIQLGKNARARVETRFDCRQVARMINDAYRSLF